MRWIFRTFIGLPVLMAVLVLQGCPSSTLTKLHDNLNKTAKALNAAAKTNRQFYDGAVYGPVGSEKAIKARQAGATAVGAANDKLIVALELADKLTPETFEGGKLEVLRVLAEASAQLHTGNPNFDLVLQGIATLITNVVVLIQAFSARELPAMKRNLQYEMQRWRAATAEV